MLRLVIPSVPIHTVTSEHLRNNRNCGAFVPVLHQPLQYMISLRYCNVHSRPRQTSKSKKKINEKERGKDSFLKRKKKAQTDVSHLSKANACLIMFYFFMLLQTLKPRVPSGPRGRRTIPDSSVRKFSIRVCSLLKLVTKTVFQFIVPEE